MKYRILHIIDSLGIGGSERQTILNLSALDRSRFENYLCYLHGPSSLVDDVHNLGIDVFCLGVKGKGDWVSGISRLVRHIKTNKIDLVHTSLADSDVLGGIAAKLAGVPVISTWTAPARSALRFASELHVKRYKLELARLLRRSVFSTCHRHFVAVSEQVARSYIDSYGQDRARIMVIPRAISPGFLREEPADSIVEARGKLSLDGSYPVLLNVGRLVPQKGQGYLLQAMPLVLRSLPKAKLIIAGEGPLRTELEKTKAELGLDEAVSLLGVYGDVKMLHLVSDIFVFPSLSEGMPGALLEAAAMAKPCVAFDIDPVREISGEGEAVALVPQKDPRALARAIIRLSSSNKEAAALGMRARETVLSRFHIDNTIKQLEALYTRILTA
jgi:glycosyltransferase involved in cell wall biosynthesis